MQFFNSLSSVYGLGLIGLFFVLNDAIGAPPRDYPQRLLIALDGISWFDVKELQTRAQSPCLTQFAPVAKMVSTYPSLSDIAWADILRTPPPAGYQRYHFSSGFNKVVGGSLTDLGNPLEYEKRMHVAFMSPIEHLQTYMNPSKMADEEMDAVLNYVRTAGTVPLVAAYLVSTDSMQHTHGDIKGLLCRIGDRLDRLQQEVQSATGRRLEILIVSDHGNNHRDQGKLVDLRERLKAAGFRVKRAIEGPKDVAFTTGGILASVSLFARQESLGSLVSLALNTPGVDLVSRVDGDGIWIYHPKEGVARVEKHPSEDAYSYQPYSGDPLGYLKHVSSRGLVVTTPGQRFFSGSDWLKATADLHYPAGPERIWRGHHVITLNPAPLIITLKDGYEITYGSVKTLSRIKKRGGTHGNLGAPSSLGVILSNFDQPEDLLSKDVLSRYPLSQMRDWRTEARGANFFLKDWDGMGRGLSTATFVDNVFSLQLEQRATSPVWLNVHSSQFSLWRSLNLDLVFEVQIKRVFEWGSLFSSEPVGDGERDSDESRTDRMKTVFRAENLSISTDGSQYRIPLSSTWNLQGLHALSAGQYIVRVNEQLLEPATGERKRNRTLFHERFIVDVDGRVLPW